MGMCKECGQVNSVLEMNNGYCKNCITPDKLKAAEENNNLLANQYQFGWWEAWAWLGLTLGNLTIFGQLLGAPEIAFIFVLINSILMILILRYNKYAFLTATILSFNPLLWIINGIYLKNRWCHPKVNKNIACGQYI
jgi:hypothetical protein